MTINEFNQALATPKQAFAASKNDDALLDAVKPLCSSSIRSAEDLNLVRWPEWF